MKNLAFHILLRWQMIYYQFSLPHLYISLKWLGECTFWTWKLKGNSLTLSQLLCPSSGSRVPTPNCYKTSLSPPPCVTNSTTLHLPPLHLCWWWWRVQRVWLVPGSLPSLTINGCVDILRVWRPVTMGANPGKSANKAIRWRISHSVE